MGLIIGIIFILIGILIYCAQKRREKLLDEIAKKDPAAANRIATMNCKAPVPRCKCGRRMM